MSIFFPLYITLSCFNSYYGTLLPFYILFPFLFIRSCYVLFWDGFGIYAVDFFKYFFKYKYETQLLYNSIILLIVIGEGYFEVSGFFGVGVLGLGLFGFWGWGWGFLDILDIGVGVVFKNYMRIICEFNKI